MAVPRLAGPLLQAIAATTAWLKQANISAAVIGGVAASLLGHPLVTKDVDLVALADDSDVPRLLCSDASMVSSRALPMQSLSRGCRAFSY